MSDLHIGGCRGKDLSCGSNDRAIDPNYQQRFLKFISQHGHAAKYLVVPGDISNRAQPSEFALASGLLEAAAKALNVPKKRIIAVPGNHDVDWEVLKIPDSTGMRREQRYDPLRRSDGLLAKVFGSDRKRIFQSPHFCSWQESDLLAIGYNSAWHDDPKVSVHHGLVAEESLQALESFLSAITYEPSALRVFIVHHHPVQYSDPIPEEPDFSAMTNAPRLLELLQRHRFDVVIHGHKHVPQLTTQIVNAGFPIAILAAGSFSAALDTRWSGHVSNQFHLLHIEGRDNLGCVVGDVESWTFLSGRGWTPSTVHHGIRHRSPFGTYLQPSELAKLLQDELPRLLDGKNHVKWSEVVGAIPKLKHLPPDKVLDAVRGVASALALEHHGSPEDDLLLYRQSQ